MGRRRSRSNPRERSNSSKKKKNSHRDEQPRQQSPQQRRSLEQVTHLGCNRNNSRSNSSEEISDTFLANMVMPNDIKQNFKEGKTPIIKGQPVQSDDGR